MIGTSYIKRSQAYRNLAQMLEGGVAVDQALNTLLGSRSADRERIQRLLLSVRRGSSLASAMHDYPKLDIAMVKVGEKTGHLPDTLRFLSSYYESQHKLAASIRSAMVQPGLLFVVSVFMRDFPAVFVGKMAIPEYLLRAAVPLAVVASVVFLIFHTLRQANESPRAAEAVWSVARMIPWLGGRMKAAQTEKLFICLDLCFRAGTQLEEALEIAGSMVISPTLKAAIAHIRARQGKLGFARAMESTGAFRASHVAEVRAGETAGSLDAAFLRISLELRAETEAALEQFRQYAPKVLYFIAAIYVASGILKSMPPLPTLPD